MRVLSVCTSAGLWDRAFIEAGHEVVAGCEIMPHKRAMYEAFCGGKHLVHDIADLPDAIRGQHFDGVIGGIPCQSRTKLKAIRPPKFGDLLPHFLAVLEACTWDWCVAENVTALDIPGFKRQRMNAMNYGQPHQSRERWFTYSPNLTPPPQLYPGDVDDLLAYSVVAGRIYGPKRGSRLQGWPEFMALAGKFSCVEMQEALADGVAAWLGRRVDSPSRATGKDRSMKSQSRRTQREVIALKRQYSEPDDDDTDTGDFSDGCGEGQEDEQEQQQ